MVRVRVNFVVRVRVNFVVRVRVNFVVRVRVRVNFVVRVSKLLGLNFDPNPNCNFALTLIMTLNSP